LIEVIALGLELLHVGAASSRRRTGCAAPVLRNAVIVRRRLGGAGFVVGVLPVLGIVFVVNRYARHGVVLLRGHWPHLKSESPNPQSAIRNPFTRLP
jgi:hypothetical protein